MKRITIILAAAALAVASCGGPLRIAMNTTSPDGTRNIVTSNQHLFRFNKGNIEIALGARITDRDTVLGILVTCDAHTDYGIFDKGNRMMFRLSDGSEISLSNIYEREYEQHEETSVSNQYRTDYGYAYSYSPLMDDIYITPFEVNRLVPRVNTYKVTNSYALYLITKKQLEDIIGKGVMKIRVETDSHDLDMNDTQEASQLFSAMYACLKTGFANAVVRSEF